MSACRAVVHRESCVVPIFRLWLNYFGSLLSESESCSLVSDFLATPCTVALQAPCPWNSPGRDTRVVCHSLLHRVFPTQGLNPGILCCGQILYHLSHQGSPAYCLKLPYCSEVKINSVFGTLTPKSCGISEKTEPGSLRIDTNDRKF